MINSLRDLFDYFNIDTIYEINDSMAEYAQCACWMAITMKDNNVFDSRYIDDIDDEEINDNIDFITIVAHNNVNGIEMEEDFVFPIDPEIIDDWFDEIKLSCEESDEDLYNSCDSECVIYNFDEVVDDCYIDDDICDDEVEFIKKRSGFNIQDGDDLDNQIEDDDI